MFDIIKEIHGKLRNAVEGLDPALLRPADAAVLFEQFTQMQKLCSGAAMRLSSRAADARTWRQQGERSAAEWIAKQTGTSITNAASMLETGKRLAQLPECDEAVKKGQISQRQAEQIATAAAADPAAQSDLLAAAKTEGFSGLKARCAGVRAAACPDELERHEQIRRSRYLRHFTDELGAFCLQGRFTPEAGAVVLSALEPYKDQVFDQARKPGRKEPHQAYMADALVAMAQDSRCPATGPGQQRKGPGAMIHVTVDHSALVRGHTTNGETCEIPGIGPIPVATAKALLSDAFLSVIVTDGADIKAVCHSGRHIPAKVRTALVKRDPVCVVPGCERRDRLQIDHIREYSSGGPTALDNLARLCGWHHHLKTHQSYRLEGSPGDWSFTPPKSSKSSPPRPARDSKLPPPRPPKNSRPPPKPQDAANRGSQSSPERHGGGVSLETDDHPKALQLSGVP